MVGTGGGGTAVGGLAGVSEEGCVLFEVLQANACLPGAAAAAETCKGSQSWST